MEREMQLRSVNGELLIGKLWGDPEQARAIVVLMHGLGEHIGRYEHVAAKFVERENDKLITITVNKDIANKDIVERFSYLKFLKSSLQIVVPADTTNPVLKLENGILEIQLDYVENTRKTEVLDIL